MSGFASGKNLDNDLEKILILILQCYNIKQISVTSERDVTIFQH